jgi:hypothetical protein
MAFYIKHNKLMILEKLQHNALCLLGIDDDWTVNDIREHLTWLTQNPNEISEGYHKDHMMKEHITDTMQWVIVNKGIKKIKLTK